MAEQPDITVSIDFGTTFTGAAWTRPRMPIQIINNWPGSGGGERKVPTTLIYNPDGSISTWGFMCADDDDTIPGKTRREFFKILIDSKTLQGVQSSGLTDAPRSVEEASGFATDYLRKIYGHLKETIENATGKAYSGGWAGMAVSFLFSVPTTWTNQGIINIFKGIIRNAGFGVEGIRHTAEVDLTESEAASVATLKTNTIDFKVNSLFLTVDAGGGTTDLALMKVDSTDANLPRMSQVTAVDGIGIGSSLIDRDFVALISQRLQKNPDAQSQLPGDLALRLSRSHNYKIMKHKFGEAAYLQSVYRIPIEGVSFDFTHPGVGIEGGKMLVTYEEMKLLFDVQINGVMGKIIEQLDWMRNTGRKEQIDAMILAGGLGSSAYVRDSLQQWLVHCNHPNASQVAVITSPEPQLVVTRGLLLDHEQKFKTGSTGVLGTRIARASYGVLVYQVFSEIGHEGEDWRMDPFDPTQKWAINQIHWLIRKGDEIKNEPLIKSFEIRLAEKDTTRAWDAEIVMSTNEAAWLPRSMKKAGAKKLCSVRSNLEGIQLHDLIMKKKRGTCFSKGHTWYVCNFEVRVIVAPADLRFELWFGGQKFSGNHKPISVEWDAAGAA